MTYLIFSIYELPDLSSQKYISLHGQGVRQKAVSCQKDFLLLISDLAQIYQLTFSIRYFYDHTQSFDRRLKIYLVVSSSQQSLDNKKKEDIEKLVTKGFLAQFYKIEKVKNLPEKLQNYSWVDYVGESIKHEELIGAKAKDSLSSLSQKGLKKYYVPLPIEAEEGNDMLTVCQAMSSFQKDPLLLEITLQPDTTSLQQKAGWINALDGMLSELKKASSGSSGLGGVKKDGDKNAQTVSKIYEKYQSSYLTENLYSYSFKALGKDELAVRSILGTLMLSGTKKSRYRTIILQKEKDRSQFEASLEATKEGKLSTIAEWSAWENDLKDASFGGDSLSGTGSIRVSQLKPLHRYATLNEIGGLFRIVVPSDAPVSGISQENDLKSVDEEQAWIDYGGHEISRPEHRVQIELDKFNKHAFICGVPGSGKTTTAFNLLTQVWCHDVPFLVFEPAKTEYRILLDIQPREDLFPENQLLKIKDLTTKLRVYTLGNDSLSPFRFNPFAVSDGVPFFEHIANLEGCFKGALPLSGPLPALLSEALEEIYYDRNWTGYETGTPEHLCSNVPTMRDLYEKITELFDSKDYAGEVKSNLKTALEVRIGSLLRRGVGAMLNTQQSYPTIADLLKHPTILELDYLNTEQANLMTFFLLTKIREYIKRARTEEPGNPEHIMFLEEAHNIVGRNSGAGSSEDANTQREAANYITKMLAEMRALREGIIIADQLPTTVAAEVVKNTNIKIAHRLVSADDREDMGQAMLLNPNQTEEIARFNPGECFLYMEGWYRPHGVKSSHSAKDKLGADKSLTDEQLKHRIQTCDWYKGGQSALLDSTISEFNRLAKEYSKSLEGFRFKLNKVEQNYKNSENLLRETTQETFNYLMSELHFKLTSTPKDNIQLQLALVKKAEANLANMANLSHSSNISLSKLIKIKFYLDDRIKLFAQQYQEAIKSQKLISKTKYEQQWHKLERNLKNTWQQIEKLSAIHGQSPQAENLLHKWQNLNLEKRTLTEEKENQIKDLSNRIKKEQEQLSRKLNQVLAKAIKTAKIEKIKQDIEKGGK